MPRVRDAIGILDRETGYVKPVQAILEAAGDPARRGANIDRNPMCSRRSFCRIAIICFFAGDETGSGGDDEGGEDFVARLNQPWC